MEQATFKGGQDTPDRLLRPQSLKHIQTKTPSFENGSCGNLTRVSLLDEKQCLCRLYATENLFPGAFGDRGGFTD